jgi:hypothetical protein
VALVCPCSRKRLLCVLVAEAACQSYEEEDTCQSYEEEDTCQSYLVAKAAVVKWSSFYIIRVRRRIHVSHTL